MCVCVCVCECLVLYVMCIYELEKNRMLKVKENIELDSEILVCVVKFPKPTFWVRAEGHHFLTLAYKVSSS